MNDARWMKSALTLARRALGRTWPNPAVGCVLVRDGRVIGRGATAPGGRPHAETEALTQAKRLGEDPAGATAYVSLEPCAHHGKTPPCTQALISAGIARVVCPIADPDPRVAGTGFDALRAAGIAVDLGLMEADARVMNRGFLSRLEHQRPHDLLKIATTLDGRIATSRGESRWITGPAARRQVHLMRAQSDALLIGAGTARTDDPMLDVRSPGLENRSPVRVIADPSLSLPLTGRIAQTARTIPTWIAHRDNAAPDRQSALRDIGCDLIATPTAGDGLDMSALLHALGERGITRLMCEGGGRLAASLLAAGLVDELVQFSAGRVVGGDGIPAVRGFGLERLGDAPEFELVDVRSIDGDVLTVWSRSGQR